MWHELVCRACLPSTANVPLKTQEMLLVQLPNMSRLLLRASVFPHRFGLSLGVERLKPLGGDLTCLEAVQAINFLRHISAMQSVLAGEAS